ncbi:hypothetical protein GCM10028822_26540 [Hymenobacter terrigena]
MNETCFVAMAISEQTVGDSTITAEHLQSMYEDVIKVALQTSRPNLDIVRADEIAMPGSISTDILSHLMHDDFVIVDISYPNPNVYYELGVRHCCKPGTILIRNSAAGTKPAFDVSHQRYIEYEFSPKGIKDLTKSFREYFSWYDKNSEKPDNQVLQFAQLIRYNFPQYDVVKEKTPVEAATELFMMMMTNPEFLMLIGDTTMNQEEKNAAILRSLTDKPEAMKIVIQLLMQGKIDLLTNFPGA